MIWLVVIHNQNDGSVFSLNWFRSLRELLDNFQECTKIIIEDDRHLIRIYKIDFKLGYCTLLE